MKVRDIYSQKYFSCNPEDTLQEVVQNMTDNHTNTLIVVDENGVYQGVVTSKHLIMAVLPDFLEDKQIAALAGAGDFEKAVQESKDMKVSEFMAKEVKPVTLDTPLVRVAVNVLYQNESRLPVVDEDMKVVGIVTRTHIKQAVAQILNIVENQ